MRRFPLNINSVIIHPFWERGEMAGGVSGTLFRLYVALSDACQFSTQFHGTEVRAAHGAVIA